MSALPVMYTRHAWLHTTPVVEFEDIKQRKSASVATNMSNFWHSKTLPKPVHHCVTELLLYSICTVATYGNL